MPDVPPPSRTSHPAPRAAGCDACPDWAGAGFRLGATPDRLRRDALGELLVDVWPRGTAVVTWLRHRDGAWTRDGPPLVHHPAGGPPAAGNHLAIARTLAALAARGDGATTDRRPGTCHAAAVDADHAAVACLEGEADGAGATLLAVARLAARVAAQATDRRPPSCPTLPAAQRRVFELLLTGLAERDIAARLEMTPDAAHGRIRRLYRKLGVTSRPELMARYLANR